MVRLPLHRDLVDGLEHGDGVGEAAVVLPQRPVRVDRLHLGDDVELAAPVALERDVAGGLEAGAEAAPGLADALGDGPHLAVALGEHRDDAVRLAELDRAEDHALVPVERHDRSVVTPVSPVTLSARPHSMAPKRRLAVLELADRREQVLRAGSRARARR